jgi:hypothetical protein
MTSCGNEPLFKDGKGCGSCYQVGLRSSWSCLPGGNGIGHTHTHSHSLRQC